MGKRTAGRTVPAAETKNGPQRFFQHFLAELHSDGYTPAQIARYVWKPFAAEDLAITGPDRDLSYHKVEATPAEIERYLEHLPKSRVRAGNLLREQKLIIILLPGFTHQTLQYPAFHELVEPQHSPLEVLKIQPGPSGKQPVETFTNRGSGAKLVYLAYPRSNAAIDVILRPTFHMMEQSVNLRRWVEHKGYKILFVGYSYGAPLALELLAGMNTRRLRDSFVLRNTAALLTINGDIGGSYLADVVAHPETTVNAQMAVDLVRRFPLLGGPLGIADEQTRDDLVDGIKSLGHDVRQASIRRIAKEVPTDIAYVSISAFLPQEDYNANPLTDFDDWSMYMQSLAGTDVSIYNDGQMILDDTFLPELPMVAKNKRFNLGAVRSTHWGVSWETFNFGSNSFPRPAYYRALLETLYDLGIRN